MTLRAVAGSGGLGAPGIRLVTPEGAPQIVGVGRDVAAFFGVAPRGPARTPIDRPPLDRTVVGWMAAATVARTVPVRVTSWDEYRWHFGGFEGPGRLPYAVSRFFANGGRTAYVCRVVHDDGPGADPLAARAGGTLGATTTIAGAAVDVVASSEGSWGNGLRTPSPSARPVPVDPLGPAELVTDPDTWVPDGSLLRLGLPGDVHVLRFVDAPVRRPDPTGPGDRRHLLLDAALPAPPVRCEVVTGVLEIVDVDPSIERRERLAEVGFSPEHPRWLGRVLIDESSLLWPSGSWLGDRMALADASLAAIEGTDGEGASLSGGIDRWSEIVPEDVLDPSWTRGDEVPGDGITAIADHDDIGLVLVPDLYDPAPLPRPAADEVVTLCGPDFGEHVDVGPVVAPAPIVPGLLGLALDPAVPADLDRIVTAQLALVDHLGDRRDLTVLLDVPPGLSQRELRRWRSRFASPFAAAYHPWIDVAAPDDARDRLVRINPSAFAAGIIAERERRLGVQHGPANQVAIGAVRVAAEVPADQHDELHVSGINVFLPDRDGVLLTGARTLSDDPLLRQLSVVRLMTVLRLSLQREMQWATFEPNNRILWAEIRRTVQTFLTRLYEAGAFRGATTREAFFVRCDDSTMTRADLDHGRMVCLVGVAPAEPIEMLLIEIAREADGTVTVESARTAAR